MTDECKICTFHVAEYFFGLDVSRIQEVIRYQEMTHIPLAHETISGLINMRGQIVTAINMRQRLGFSAMPENEKPLNIIVRTDDGAVSLLVDNIGDVIDIPRDTFEALPENLKGDIQQVLKEVCKLDNKLLLILDIEQVLNIGQEELSTM